MSMQKKLSDLFEDFSLITNDKERLELIMEFGEDLKKPSVNFTSEERVPGCASEVFVSVKLQDNNISFQMWSTSLIIKGYCALLKEIFDGESKETILSSERSITAFIKDASLDASLIPSRTNSFERLYTFMLNAVKKL